MTASHDLLAKVKEKNVDFNLSRTSVMETPGAGREGSLVLSNAKSLSVNASESDETLTEGRLSGIAMLVLISVMT